MFCIGNPEHPWLFHAVNGGAKLPNCKIKKLFPACAGLKALGNLESTEILNIITP